MYCSMTMGLIPRKLIISYENINFACGIPIFNVLFVTVSTNDFYSFIFSFSVSVAAHARSVDIFLLRLN
jgi:hypothetical protein